MPRARVWYLVLLAVGLPAVAGAQSRFALAARGGWSGFTGSDLASAGSALLLDLSLRYGRRHGLSGSAGGHFSNHTEADSIELDAVGAYVEARYTGPTLSANAAPFATVRGGYTRHGFTTTSGAATQEGSQDGWTIGGTVGAALELAERVDIEIAGMYTLVRLGDATINGNPRPGSHRSGGQWALLVGVAFRPGG